jgi:formyl-CoA transferase
MVINYTKTGAIAKRAGNRARWSTPRNTYRTRDDRWIAVSSAADSAAMRLFKAIGREDLTRDPNWQTNPERLKRLEECDTLVADWIAARDQKEALEQFEKFDVIAGPVYDVEQLVNDPHVQARETMVEVADPKIGKTMVQDVVPRFTNAPGKMQWLGVDQIGQHTADVMRELGYSDEQISKLAHQRVLPARTAVADEVE